MKKQVTDEHIKIIIDLMIERDNLKKRLETIEGYLENSNEILVEYLRQILTKEDTK